MKLVSRMLPYLVLVLAFAIPVQAQGTGELTGTVLGFQSEPLASAAIRIEIDGEQREFPTAEDGTYSATLPAGTYTVTLLVQRQAITTVEATIRANQEVQGNFDLSSFSDEDQQRALEMLEAGVDADAVRAAFDLGRAAMTAGNFDEAVEQFTVAVANDDQHVILANLAQALSSAGRHDDAAENYRLALVQDPENPIYLQNRGIALGNSGDVGGAVESITQAAVLDPLMAGPGHFNLGIIFINRGQLAEAVESFRSSIEADDSYAQAYYQLGLALVGTAPADAVEPLERFLELVSDDPNATTAQGLLEYARTQ